MAAADVPAASKLERSISQQSTSSARSNRSATLRGRPRKLASQPGSASSSVAPSDKSLTSFPSFSPEAPSAPRFFENTDNIERLKTATQESEDSKRDRALSGHASIVESLIDRNVSGDALFADAPLGRSVPGALHQADDQHIERLIARHGAVSLVRQLATDLAQRDTQISSLRRRADERQRALRRILRECGLSTLDVETRLREVENDMKSDATLRRQEGGLSDMLSGAMQDDMSESTYTDNGVTGTTVRANTIAQPGSQTVGRRTTRGWKEYIWGTGTRKSNRPNVNGDAITAEAALRAHSAADRRPALPDDLFDPPDSRSVRSSSRASSIYSGYTSDRSQEPASLASMALKLVAGNVVQQPELPRGRATSYADISGAARAMSSASQRVGRPSAVGAGPRALMAMRRTTHSSIPTVNSTRQQAAESWNNMASSPPNALSARQESYGPVEMDAILPPETQPPTLNQMYNNYANNSHLTDRFGFIYDQRRKKRQREAAQMTKRIKQGTRAEMLTTGRNGISPNLLDDLPSPKWSVSSEGRPSTPGSIDDVVQDESKPKRWQDYLKIATFPTELLSHTPSVSASAIEVMETTGILSADNDDRARPHGIKPTGAGLVPIASPTTAIDSEATTQVSEQESMITAPTTGATTPDDTEPVKLLLQQLSEVHDVLQRDKAARWNEFLRKVRAERKREGDAAVAAANAAAEARFEQPAVILPETRVADGEMIGISGLGNKGKVGRAKWNEFKTLVLGGIPVTYRAKIWSECSGAVALRIPGYYDDIVAQNPEEDDPTVVGQIQMDIHRTLTDNIFFREGPGVQKLNEVLVAYSRRNKDVGYCQGMNLITANLLLITPSAEEAFWILASIVENILPHGYYDQSLISSRADQQVLRQYVTAVLPKLSAHLESLSIELEALTFQWFLSVFTDCLSAEALFRVWDVVLCTNDGSTFLFQVALALLKLNEQNLLKCDTPARIYTYINHQMTEHAISIDGLMQASEGLRREVRRDEVEQRRDKVIQAERDSIAERESIARKRKESSAAAKQQKLKTAETSETASIASSSAPLPAEEARPTE
ncbi:Putative TBC domain-containing protein [[Torrubiella] hemipterigena]|uniref:Putative TBC domain-containing protein n=1 Tax=[Torrubiella] hemipterigena TaxID=1531966 RepID=A0A0A1SN52_9HYPO|nr:Putative TBC domain-containing protein [[Torrubiella] hemipterigena]